MPPGGSALIFCFNDTATTEIYTLSLHDALPISVPIPMAIVIVSWVCFSCAFCLAFLRAAARSCPRPSSDAIEPRQVRSEEHTSELQSPDHLVCRLLLEKKILLHTKILIAL